MPVHNNLKIAILAIITSPHIYALTLDPIEVQSGAGNLFYAEMKFRNADPNARVEASMAEADDVMTLGLANQSPQNLNFYTRRNADGTGVIVITSSRPIVESELNILLKIKEGNATHIQQIKTRLNKPINNITNKARISAHESPLQPQTIVSEKDIALNLPTSAQFASSNLQTNASVAITPPLDRSASSTLANNMPLVINVAPMPELKNQSNAAVTQSAVQIKNLSQQPTTVSTTSYDKPSIGIVQPIASPTQSLNPITSTPVETKSIAQPIKNDISKNELKTSKPVKDQLNSKNSLKSETKAKQESQPKTQAEQPTTSNAHVVQANESLWKIAERVAAQTHQTIPEAMKQIKEQNEHAFIGGNINRIRRGVALNLATGTHSNTQKVTQAAVKSTSTSRQSAIKEKYRLNQAEMSLVAENNQSSAQGAEKEKTSQNQSTSELTAKVMTARQKTVKLQNNVSKLTLALQQRDQRIQLLNARLAQLQQQLQQQSHAKKPAH